MKKLIRLTAAILAAAMLGGCAAYRGYSYAMPQPDNAYSDTPQYSREQLEEWYSQYMQGQGDTLTEAQRSYGSTGLLAWPSALVSVYLNEENGAQWSEEMLAQSRASLAVAVSWIEEQAAQYGANTKIYCDDGTEDSDLFYIADYEGTFAGGEESNESEEFHLSVEEMCAELDSDALHRKYGTSSVGFLIFLPVEGCSFTMVHYQEDGDSYYYEYSCLYAYDVYSAPGVYDGPTVYAHEILHQYGAPDLYEGSTDYYVTPGLIQYVEETWPDAIMQNTYEPDGSIAYGVINKSICPLTACRLGLCQSFAGVEQFPQVRQTAAGTFVQEAPVTAESGRWGAYPCEGVAV